MEAGDQNDRGDDHAEVWLDEDELIEVDDDFDGIIERGVQQMEQKNHTITIEEIDPSRLGWEIKITFPDSKGLNVDKRLQMHEDYQTLKSMFAQGYGLMTADSATRTVTLKSASNVQHKKFPKQFIELTKKYDVSVDLEGYTGGDAVAAVQVSVSEDVLATQLQNCKTVIVKLPRDGGQADKLILQLAKSASEEGFSLIIKKSEGKVIMKRREKKQKALSKNFIFLLRNFQLEVK